MNQLIGLCGYAGSGKDTAAAHMPGWTRVSFADGVREVALAINPLVACDNEDMRCFYVLRYVVNDLGWDRAKKLSHVRDYLQRIGTEAGRNIIGENVWVDIAKRKAEAIDGPVVVTDVRFPNEVEFIRSSGGILIRVIRPGVGPVNGHASETAIDHIEADAEVVNSGTPERLGQLVLEVLEYRAEATAWLSEADAVADSIDLL